MKNRRYLNREVERRVQEHLQREKAHCKRGGIREEGDSRGRKKGVSWSDGGESEENLQRPRSVSESWLKEGH